MRGLTDTSPRDAKQKLRIRPFPASLAIAIVFGAAMYFVFTAGR